MTGGAFDETILKTAVQRRDVLTALARSPRHRRELQEELDISKTTCHRIVRTFDDNGLLDRTDSGYALTRRGELLETYVDEYARNVRATFELAPLVAAFADLPVDFDVELFADAAVTRPDPNDPTIPLNREFDLFRDADYFTVVDTNQHVPPLYLERVLDIAIEDGKRAEHIAPKAVIQKRLDEFPDVHQRHDDVDAELTYRVCDEATFGLTLYEHDHVVLRAYDDDTGSITLLVDTDDPGAVSWAGDVVEHYRGRADPPSTYGDLPDWTPAADPGF